jgi:plastocyanin
MVLAAAAALMGPRLPAAPAEPLEGVVELTENGKPVPGAGGAVVSYEPEGGAPRPAARPAEIATRDKRFMPRVTVVPRGSAVGFPNRDPIFHNVFSVSPGNRFDLGRYREGQSRTARFDQAGLVRVYCNVHEQMVAYVLVVETPYHALAGEDGRFRIDGVPPGRGTLAIWHERAGSLRVPIEVPPARPIHIRLEASPARDAHHLNKFGRPYGSEPDGGYR